MKDTTKLKLTKLGIALGGLGIAGLTVYAGYKYCKKLGYDEGYSHGVHDAADSAQKFLYDSLVYPEASNQVANGISVNRKCPVEIDDLEAKCLDTDFGNHDWRIKMVVVQKPKGYEDALKKNPVTEELHPVKVNWTQLIREQWEPDFNKDMEALVSPEAEEEKETEEVVG